MANARRRIRVKEELGPAERAWLTGESVEACGGNPDDFDGYFLWCLENGMASWHRGQPRTARWLLDSYGSLVPSGRRELLEEQAGKTSVKTQRFVEAVRNGR